MPRKSKYEFEDQPYAPFMYLRPEYEPDMTFPVEAPSGAPGAFAPSLMKRAGPGSYNLQLRGKSPSIGMVNADYLYTLAGGQQLRADPSWSQNMVDSFVDPAIAAQQMPFVAPTRESPMQQKLLVKAFSKRSKAMITPSGKKR